MLNHNEVNHLNQNGMHTVKPPIIIPAVTLDAEDLRELAAIREQSQQGQESQPETLSLAAFVEDFGSGLMEAVRSQNPPVFTGETKPARETLLAGLKRKLFSAQAKAVHAATTLLCDHDEKSAIINGEMGVGKTSVGIAIAALLHAEGYSRTLILSPPHLVYKWRREILDMVPQAEVVILNGADTINTLQRLRQTADHPPTHPAFYILGRVRLRIGHHWRVAVQPRLAGAVLRTPKMIGKRKYILNTICDSDSPVARNAWLW